MAVIVVSAVKGSWGKCLFSAIPDVNGDVFKCFSQEYAEKNLIKLVVAGTDTTCEQNIDVVTQKRKLSQQWLRFPTNPVIFL